MIKLIVYEQGSEAWDLALLKGVNTSFFKKKEKKNRKSLARLRAEAAQAKGLMRC